VQWSGGDIIGNDKDIHIHTAQHVHIYSGELLERSEQAGRSGAAGRVLGRIRNSRVCLCLLRIEEVFGLVHGYILEMAEEVEFGYD
jgi:hypothetical protein